MGHGKNKTPVRGLVRTGAMAEITKWRSPVAGASATPNRNSQSLDGIANLTAATHNAAQAEYDRLARRWMLAPEHTEIFR